MAVGELGKPWKAVCDKTEGEEREREKREIEREGEAERDDDESDICAKFSADYRKLVANINTNH